MMTLMRSILTSSVELEWLDITTIHPSGQVERTAARTRCPKPIGACLASALLPHGRLDWPSPAHPDGTLR